MRVTFYEWLKFILFVVAISFSKSMVLKPFYFKQFFNNKSLFSILKVLSNPYLMLPTISVRSLNDLNLNTLKKRGVRGIIFDKDNTLTITYQNTLHSSVTKVINECKQVT